MSTSAGGADTCRITVVGPRRRVDLALPTRIPFAELFPAVVDDCVDDRPDRVAE